MTFSWIKDCLRERKRILTGKFGHWCPDWDELPIDETTPEIECCTHVTSLQIGPKRISAWRRPPGSFIR